MSLGYLFLVEQLHHRIEFFFDTVHGWYKRGSGPRLSWPKAVTPVACLALCFPFLWQHLEVCCHGSFEHVEHHRALIIQPSLGVCFNMKQVKQAAFSRNCNRSLSNDFGWCGSSSHCIWCSFFSLLGSQLVLEFPFEAEGRTVGSGAAWKSRCADCWHAVFKCFYAVELWIWILWKDLKSELI